MRRSLAVEFASGLLMAGGQNPNPHPWRDADPHPYHNAYLYRDSHAYPDANSCPRPCATRGERLYCPGLPAGPGAG